MLRRVVITGDLSKKVAKTVVDIAVLKYTDSHGVNIGRVRSVKEKITQVSPLFFKWRESLQQGVLSLSKDSLECGMARAKLRDS